MASVTKPAPVVRSLIGGGMTAPGDAQTFSPTGLVSQGMLVSTTGFLKNLRVQIGAMLGNDLTITVRKNGVNTALAATIPAGQTSADDLVDAPDVSAGDRIDLLQTGAGTPVLTWGFEWQSE